MVINDGFLCAIDFVGNVGALLLLLTLLQWIYTTTLSPELMALLALASFDYDSSCCLFDFYRMEMLWRCYPP